MWSFIRNKQLTTAAVCPSEQQLLQYILPYCTVTSFSTCTGFPETLPVQQDVSNDPQQQSNNSASRTSGDTAAALTRQQAWSRAFSSTECSASSSSAPSTSTVLLQPVPMQPRHWQETQHLQRSQHSTHAWPSFPAWSWHHAACTRTNHDPPHPLLHHVRCLANGSEGFRRGRRGRGRRRTSGGAFGGDRFGDRYNDRDEGMSGRRGRGSGRVRATGRRQGGDGPSRSNMWINSSYGKTVMKQEGMSGADWAVANAPKKVLNLIGDPRTGVADDTTVNPFGETTVDMSWVEPSNEVYWFKYEFAGDLLMEGHRDSRLSDYSKNLIYLLRAKDPNRWTISELAKKFRIRKQRVLAIIALKELEAQAIERGDLLPGALRAYASTVNLDDFHIDPSPELAKVADNATTDATTMPIASDMGLADFLAEEGPTSSADSDAVSTDASTAVSSAGSSTPIVPLHQLLPQLRHMAERLQSEMVALLLAAQYDVEVLRSQVLADVDQAEQLLKEHFEGHEELAASMDLAGFRSQLESALEAVGHSFQGTGVEQGKQLTWLQGLAAKLKTARDGGVAGQTDGVLSEIDEFMRSKSAGEVRTVLESLDAASRKILLDPHQRSQEMVIKLNEGGADIEKLQTQGDERKGADTFDFSSGQPAPPLSDVWAGHVVPEEVLARSLEAAGKLREAAEKALNTIGAETDKTSPLLDIPLPNYQQLRKLLGHYLSTLDVYNELHVNAYKTAAESARSVDPLKLFEAVRDDLQVESTGLDGESRSRSMQELQDEAIRVLGKQLQQLSRLDPYNTDPQSAGEASGENESVSEEADSKPKNPFLSALGHDHLAAYIDYCIVGRIYDRGSGERNLIRVPTYPKFEGYSLEEFDRAEEGEISQVARLAAEQQEEMLYREFKQSLLYNLGLVGEGLMDSRGRALPQKPKEGWSYVVHPLGSEVKKQDTYVVQPDGSHRPLNENEEVYRQRRIPRPRRKFYY